MFEYLISFFLKNGKFNHSLFAFIVILGLISYTILPKEKFPNVELDRVLVSGGYSKTSNELLDKLAVREIEDQIKSIEGVDRVMTTISNGSFSIAVEIETGRDKSVIADKLRDAVSSASQNFPSDMNLPTVKLIERTSKVIQVGMSSNSLETTLENVDRVKDRLLAINGVANINVNGERDRFINIVVDRKLLELYKISVSDFSSMISNLSYIFPLGKIEDSKYALFLSTESGKNSMEDLENTILRFGEIEIRLKDVAKVEKKFEESSRISSVNAKESVLFEINKFEDANALLVSKDVKKFVDEFNSKNSEVELVALLDNSISIRDRLNSVVSNIIFGMILVFFSILLLINFKTALVVTIGVPTSFFIAFIYFYLFGYSLNLISLLALLIALGVLVDDAIIVSENIQRHLEDGKSIEEASLVGTKEVITPVTMASITTIFTFMPLLFLSGSTGIFMKMIPIGVTILVIASYIESFFFLPLHAKHIFKRGDKTTSWKKANDLYKKFLSFHIKYKKSFLIVFFIFLPLSIYYLGSATKFQFFPRIDEPVLYIAGKMPVDTTIDDTNRVALEITNEILKNRIELGVQNISTVAGYIQTAVGERESGDNLFYIYIELFEEVPQNIVDEYITPALSFDYDDSTKTRTLSNEKIMKILNKKLEPIKEKFAIEELSLYKKRIGVKVDVEIGVSTEKTSQLFSSIATIENELNQIKGITSVSNNALEGVDEMILKINKYGESLGVTERVLANSLSNLYLSNRKGTAIDDQELLDVVVESLDKDELKSLDSAIISVNDKVVQLKEVVNFEKKKSLYSINKQNYRQMKSIYVNVDTKIITADEVLKKLEPTFDKLREDGISFDFMGEKEKKDDLKNDLKKAVILSLSLIFLSLIYTFGSFRYTFMIMSIIPFSILGVYLGHFLMDMNLTMPGIIGAFGLAGVVINDSIVMLSFLQNAKNGEEILTLASQRFRPIILTSLTTLIGLSTLIFFVSGQGLILQPIAVSLGFGLAWGTVLNLLYLPVVFALFPRKNLI
jgi:multidrug efflux pump subunit AcrB